MQGLNPNLNEEANSIVSKRNRMNFQHWMCRISEILCYQLVASVGFGVCCCPTHFDRSSHSETNLIQNHLLIMELPGPKRLGAGRPWTP